MKQRGKQKGGAGVEERDIIERLLGRDESGLHDLLRYYGPLMRYIITPIVPDPHYREDCLSEAAMRVWDRVGQFDPSRGSFNAWLTAVVRNTARNYQRAIQSHQSTQDLDENTPSPQPTPEELLLRQERQAAVNRALARLSSEEQALFYRKYYYLQPTAQIAAELGTTERAVEGRLYRLKKRLRKLLGGEGYAGT